MEKTQKMIKIIKMEWLKRMNQQTSRKYVNTADKNEFMLKSLQKSYLVVISL